MLTEKEFDDFALDSLAPAEEQTTDRYPRLGTISPGLAAFRRAVPVLDSGPEPPEYVYIPKLFATGPSEIATKMTVAVSMWNMAWEAGHLAGEMQRSEDFPRRLRWLLKDHGRNIRLVPQHPHHRYHAQQSLYHLLSKDALVAAGLPLLRAGLWPFMMINHLTDRLIPSSFDEKFSAAFSKHIWPLLSPGNGRRAFSKDDPILALSHDLDFWLPYIDVVMARRTQALGRVKPKADDQEIIDQINREALAKHPDIGATVKSPTFGGPLWMGQHEAWDATEELIEAADQFGHLRGIVDAVRSHRIEEDFSPRWSYAREDLARKLYHKRLKVKVSLVELKEAVPVHSPDTETDGTLVCGDFLTLLDRKERRVVVCLRSGHTKVGDVATLLGYKNHSPVSKALKRIRAKATEYFDLN